MSLENRFAQYVLEHHPGEAVASLERLDQAEVVDRLSRGPVEGAATILRRLSPQYACAVLGGVDPQRAARMLESLPNDVAARVIRRAEDDVRDAILELLGSRTAQLLRAVLEFPEGSAGALMDPEILALPRELSAREALARIRKTPDTVRYNVYVVDQDQRLVGALNLRELLCARARSLLSELMVREPHRLQARADRQSVVSHPGWQEVHALPVVDESNVYLGAIRYRVLRRLERDMLDRQGGDIDTGSALGQVIAVGAMGVIDALAGSAPPRIDGRKDSV